MARCTATLAALLAFGCARPVPSRPAAPVRHAIVVSVDGMRPDVYQRPEALGLRVPTLRRLAAEGVRARVQGVLPSVTYPSHTTLATGVPPRLHGIDGNRVDTVEFRFPRGDNGLGE